MEKKQLVLDYCEYDSLQEMDAADRLLMERAMQATATAYTPYSNFHVGAALRLADGTVVTGSNQENIAYPSGLCAERTALFSASAQYPDQAVEALAVVGHFQGEYTEASPCGACRQAMSEYELRYGNKLTIFCYLAGGRIRRIEGVKSLLPFAFEAEL
ncbi:MAG: cytidine deaminase [Bacteroidales bacterium]|nr:cytidine deaminase [Candidatus Colimorpha merdihippi]MCQ2281417.1 cytidine deaminase [Bacteroidales bacterium]